MGSRLANRMAWVLALAACVTTKAAVLFHFTDLGDLAGNQLNAAGSTAYGINDYGQVTGQALVAGHVHAFLWNPASPNGTSGSMRDLGTIGDTASSTGYSINSLGQVAGWSNVVGAGAHAALWSPTTPNGTTGSWTDLSKLPGGFDASQAYDVNDSGNVILGSYVTGNVFHAALWLASVPNSSTGSLNDLGDWGWGGPIVGPLARMNGVGQVASGTLWTPFTPNGTAGSFTMISGFSAKGINASGQLAGASAGKAALWTPNSPNGMSGTISILGDLPGFVNNIARDVSDNGQIIVGEGEIASPLTHALAWTPASGLVDLNNVLDAAGAGWELQTAKGVNNFGQIVGYSESHPAGGTLRHAYLLTPIVPEPGGVVVVALAGAAVLADRRARPRIDR